MLEVLVLIVIVAVAVQATLLALLWRTLHHAAAVAELEVPEAAEPFEAPEAVEPSPEHTLRHHHRYGPKDADSIRYCRCGDRYLDGMVV